MTMINIKNQNINELELILNQTKLFPNVITDLILIYTQLNEEEILFQKLEEILEKDFCWGDCQGNIDPPERLCSKCYEISNLIHKINRFRREKKIPLILLFNGNIRYYL
jgi:hypothetical protein